MQQGPTEEWSSLGVRMVEIFSEYINRNQAEVYYILHYANGTQGPEGSDVLVKEKEQWKIGLSW